jgi:hypothetical protein
MVIFNSYISLPQGKLQFWEEIIGPLGKRETRFFRNIDKNKISILGNIKIV